MALSSSLQPSVVSSSSAPASSSSSASQGSATSSLVSSSTPSSISSTSSSAVVSSSSAASSIVSRSSADITSSAIVSSSSSSIAASSSAAPTPGCPAPAPTVAVLPTNFCLKVVTPGITSTGYTLKLSGNNVLIVRKTTEATFPIVFFNLQSSGRLVTTAGSYAAATFNSENAQVQVLRPEDNVSTISVAELRCDVGQGNILQCAACNTAFARTVFRTQSPAGDFVNDILRIGAQPTRAGSFTLQFGIFTGVDCA
ncbi:hypothetical protein GQ44DRAFT_431395 [Phaeosphaeriaceae sp. PMI808]|nr:hypothetical protein GQ44DRAFT_431395 [Phaeosphaeriaceae sp. PMI808]